MKTRILFLLAAIALHGCAAHPVANPPARKTVGYYDQLTHIIAAGVRYPSRALLANEQGTCIVKVALRRDGTLISAEITQSAGYADLDRECLAASRRVDKFPAFPESVSTEIEEFIFEMPMKFSLPSAK
ncbi:MAG: TonB family protein [Nevskia sp.]|jgi:TonB family protein|nr:TonB family protein [Nevskia sp.]